jgi:hypothetical protein
LKLEQKKRRIVQSNMRKFLAISSILFGLVLAVFLLLPILLSVSGLDKTIADYFVDKFSQNNEKLIKFGKIDVGYHSIKLDNIEFVSQTAGINLEIRGLEFDYNLIDLVQNLNKPHKAIDRIYFVEPKIIIQENTEPEIQTSTPTDTSRLVISEFVNQFDNIDRIHLKEGQIGIKKASGEILMLAKNLEGWVNALDFSRVQLKAFGDLLYGTDRNFNIDCVLNPREQEFRALIGLKNFNIRHLKKIEEEDGLTIIQGILDGQIELTGNKFEIDSIVANGEFLLSDVAANLYNLNFKDLNIPVSIKNNSVKIDNGSAVLDGSLLSFKGQIKNIFYPELTGSISSDELWLSSFSAYVDTSTIGNPVFKANASYKWTPDSYHMDSEISAESISLQDQKINNTKINLCIRDGILTIPSMNLETLGFPVTGSGRMDLMEGKYEVALSTNKDVGNYVFLDQISGGHQFANISVHGNVLEKSLDGNWSYRVENIGDTIFAVSGITKLKDAVFNFEARHSTSPNFVFTAKVSDIFNTPKINYGYVKDLPYEILTSNKWLSEFARKNTIETVIGGPLNQLNVQFTISDKNTAEHTISLTTHLSGLLQSERKVSGQLSLDRFTTEYDLMVGDNFIKGEIKSNASLRGIVDINVENDEQISSSIHLNGFHLSKLLSDSTMDQQGELFGIVEIDGDLDNPQFAANLRAEKILINDIGYYTFSIAASADTNRIQIDSLKIALNNAPILVGLMNIDLNEKTISAEAKGSQIDADYIFQTLFREQDLITGYGDYRLSVSGPLRSPKVSAEIQIENGELSEIPFDQVSFTVNDSLSDNTNFFDYENHMINVNNFVMVKGGLYHLEASGNMPIYKDGEIDLHMKFDGDFFSFLPKVDGVFSDGACFSTIELALGGTPNRIRLNSGYIQFNRGELWLNEVVDHIENMHGRIEIVEGTNQVEIKNIYGEVEGKSLTINTVRDVVTSDGTKLKPWFFDDLDLDFGVLEMETPEGGVSLQIKGFMVEGERGDIAISGRADGEKFYFAGPVKNPVAWGSATLSNTQFTFPFISQGDGEMSPAVKFLTGVYWDVLVYAGQDLEYVRKIPAFLGEVDAEVGIDPRSEGLHMVGVIQDKSFKPSGGLHSSKGRIDYLDLNFRVENFGVLFKSSEDLPEVYGRAWTSVRDSIGAVPKEIYLELYGEDPESGQESIRSRWEDLRFRLVSADPSIGETQEQVLAYLGYSVDNFSEKASEVGGAMTDNYIIRPLLRPLERNIERYLGVDFIRINTGLTKNLFAMGFNQTSSPGYYQNGMQYNRSLQPYAMLLQSSAVTVGKYLSQDLYLSYTGQLVAMNNSNNKSEFNFNHSVELEYRFLQNLLVEFEYYRESFQMYQIYTDKSYLEDFKIRLRHSFAF